MLVSAYVRMPMSLVPTVEQHVRSTEQVLQTFNPEPLPPVFKGVKDVQAV